MRVTSELTDKLEPIEIQEDILGWLSGLATLHETEVALKPAKYSMLSDSNPLAEGRWLPGGRGNYSLYAPFWLNVMPSDPSDELKHAQYTNRVRVPSLDGEDFNYRRTHPFLNGTFIVVENGSNGMVVSVQTEEIERRTSMTDGTPMGVVDAVEFPIEKVEAVEFEVVKGPATISFQRERL